jgi:RHS repeat-associated protein
MIYLSNESSNTTKLILFDEMNVTLTRPILQVNEYYPFGMEMAENGYENVLESENRYKYNGKELQDDLDLNWYDYGARMYDAAIGRFMVTDRFSEKYYDFAPYQYAANNPVLLIDVNGDSIYISHRKETIVYHDGQLYNKDGSVYHGKAYNKKGNLTGYVKQARNALDAIRTGGPAGQDLVNYFQNADFKDIQIQNDTKNGEQSGLITWNPTDRKSSIPNQVGSFGRDPYIGLAHEIGHSWDRSENGDSNVNKVWYTAADGTVVYQSEMIATWWENRVRAENNVGLREYYSYINANGSMQGESQGRLLIPGSRNSQHINFMGRLKGPVHVGTMGLGLIQNIPYQY